MIAGVVTEKIQETNKVRAHTILDSVPKTEEVEQECDL